MGTQTSTRTPAKALPPMGLPRQKARIPLEVGLRQALQGTRLARATAGTLRLSLLKIGARVTVSVRRVKVAMDSAHPSAAAFARVHARLPG